MLYVLCDVISVQKPSIPGIDSLSYVSHVPLVHILQYDVWCTRTAAELIM
jgi:hypothetical protein